MTDNPTGGSLNYIEKKYGLDLTQRAPIEIPNTGRQQLVDLFAELGFIYGAEIGVALGKFSDMIIKANPNLVKLWGIDPYLPQKGYRDYTHPKTFNQLKTDAHNLLDGYSNYEFIESTSLEAVKRFEDNSLDFVYIDGDHCYEQVVADIAAWLPKIRAGGIISGDDYFRSKGPAKMHVVDAVNGYTRAYNIRPWFLLGRQAKIEGEIRDSGRSWFWCV